MLNRRPIMFFHLLKPIEPLHLGAKDFILVLVDEEVAPWENTA